MTWIIRRVSEYSQGTTPDGTAFELSGPANAPVIALIHGLGLCRRLWDAHLPLMSRDYRVLNYDLYGHGESSPPPTTASLTVYANQLAALLDHTRIEQATVVGFSIGGMINRRFAMDHPDRLSALAILNSPHDRGADAQAQVEERALTVREQGAMATLDAALKRWFTPDYLESGAGVELVRQWRHQVDPESYAQAAWVLAHGVRELIHPSQSIAVPSLVMTCENDSGSTPAMSVDIADELDNARLDIVPALQHLGLLEQPTRFTKPILSFLEEQLT